MVNALALLMVAGSAPVEAAVPIPQPRPAQAPQADQPAGDSKPEHEAAPSPPSACRLALTDEIAIAPSVPAIHGPGACGGDDLVRLDAVVLADRRRVPLRPGGIMRCEMASAVADWLRTDMTQLATTLGTQLAELDNFDSFDCRGRNRVAGAKMSEHGRANALDLRGLKFANGVTLSLTDLAASRDAREAVLHSVCARFTTVLGPGSDGYHEDHIHIDLAERRSGYRICQWNLDGPLPAVAPLPAERPDDAPARDVAALPSGAPEPAAPARSNAPVDAAPVNAAPVVPLPAARPSIEDGQAGPATRPAPADASVPLPVPSPRRLAARSDGPAASQAAPPSPAAPPKRKKRRTPRSPFDDWFRF